MSQDSLKKESFEAFRKSFLYGSRANLNFKFLSNLSDEEGYLFFEELLSKLSECLDDGNFNRIIEHMVDWQALRYFEQKNFAYDSGPFAPLKKPLSDSKLLLLTSSGHFVEGNDPEPFGVKEMTQEESMARFEDFLKDLQPSLTSQRKHQFLNFEFGMGGMTSTTLKLIPMWLFRLVPFSNWNRRVGLEPL